MRIPEGYRLQLQGLSKEQRLLILDAVDIAVAVDDVPSCIANREGTLVEQWGEEASYSPPLLELTPIYLAEELAQPAEIDWDNVGWGDAPPVPESTRDWAGRVSMRGTTTTASMPEEPANWEAEYRLAPEFAPAFTRQVPRDVVLEDYDEELDGSVRGPFYTAVPFEDF